MSNEKRKRKGSSHKLQKKRQKTDQQQDIEQSGNKPAQISNQNQRCTQIKKNLKGNKNLKGKDVLAYIRKQKPDPWPEANMRVLN